MHKATRLGVLMSLASTGLCGAAVSIIPIQGEAGATYSQTPGPNGSVIITLESTNNAVDTIFVIIGDANDVIHSIDAWNLSTANKALRLRIGHANPGASQFLHQVDAIFARGPDTRIVSIDEIQTTGDVYQIQATNIVSGFIGGNLGDPGKTYLIELGNGNDPPQGSINSLVIAGDLIGVIDVKAGGIDFLQVEGDILVGSGNATIRTRDAIKFLNVPSGAIRANIHSGYWQSNNAVRDIGRVMARSGIVGSINARKFEAYDVLGGLPPGIRCSEGDLDATVTLTGALDREIIIGKSITSTASISVPSIAPGGQITFNNLGGSHTWSGAVTVNGSALTNPPYYTNEAEEIGGGSVGLAQFHLHEESCEPAGDGVFELRTTSSGSITQCEHHNLDLLLRFYGPITVHPAPNVENQTPPFYFWKFVGGVQQWEKIDIPDEMNPNSLELETFVDLQADPGGRVLRVRRTGGTFSTGFYRITRNGSRLTCKGVGSGAEPAVADFEYRFYVVDNCELGLLAEFDLNTDQSVNGGDIGAWAVTPVDFNQDSATDTADLAILVNAINTFSSLPN